LTRNALTESAPRLNHEGSQVAFSTLSLSELELAVSRSGLYFPLAEVTGNIWLAEPASRSERQ